MTPAQIESYVDAAAAALQLPLAAEHRPGVLSYFALAASMAELVGAHPLGVTDDPAEAFVPISPANART
ncbi:MAG: AtzG-like protein [Burkholderiales bacterium]